MTITNRTVYLSLGVLVLYFSLFVFQRFDFFDSDLGRHLTNGRVILESQTIPQTNTYSYTYPEHPTIMHHWGYGIFAFLIFSAFGSAGLALTNSLILLATLTITLLTARLNLKPPQLLLTLVATLPLFASRTDIRPETLSYLFLALFLCLLTFHQQHPNRHRLLVWLPLIQLLWVNTHIYFFLGIASIVAFTIHAYIHQYSSFKPLLVTLLSSLAILSLNPYGLQGITEPFKIVNTIQRHHITENLSPLTQLYVFDNPDISLTLLLIAISLSGLIIKSSSAKQPATYQLLLTSIALFMGSTMTRNSTVFAILWATTTAPLIFNKFHIIPSASRALKLTTLVMIILIFVLKFAPNFNTLGLGFQSDKLAGFEFLAANPPSSPIFNDFDIGSSLIYYLYPHTKVFLDNRAEAYPESFFTQEYLPLLNDPNLWQDLDNTYNFQTVILSNTDLSPGIKQLSTILSSSNLWLLSYQDDYLMVLTKQAPLSP